MVMMHAMAVGARTAVSGGFRARLRDARGRWAVVSASPLIGDDEDQVAVTFEPATGDQLIGLLLTAYGVSPRAREVCREVLAGHSTAEIAGRLFISANTVQDHLKSVFTKVGVRSRGELVARLRPTSHDFSRTDPRCEPACSRPLSVCATWNACPSRPLSRLRAAGNVDIDRR